MNITRRLLPPGTNLQDGTNLQNSSNVDDLKDFINDPNNTTQSKSSAILELGKVVDRRSVEPLIAMMNDPLNAMELRNPASEAIGKLLLFVSTILRDRAPVEP